VRALLRILLVILGLGFGLGATSTPSLAGSPSAHATVADPWSLDGTDRPEVPADWGTVTGDYVRIHHHPDDHGVAMLLARHAATSVPAFADRLDVPSGGVMDVYLAHTDAQFAAMQPGASPDWADGTAWPLRGLIFLRTPTIRRGASEALETVLDHEVVHVLMGRAFKGRPVPRWLQEGVAQVYARQYSSATTDALAAGLLGHGLMPMEDLATGFPADPVRARLAYAQSADLVAWLQNTYGPATIPTLVRSLAHGDGFGAAVHQSTGQYVDQVDRAWRGRLASSGLWLRPLTSQTTLLAVGAVVLVIGGLGVRRRTRVRLDRMDAEERSRDAVARAMGMAEEPGPWQHPVPPVTDGYRWPPEPRGPSDWVH